jgi:hypothetical protein
MELRADEVPREASAGARRFTARISIAGLVVFLVPDLEGVIG